MTARLTARFDDLRRQGRAGLVTYLVAGDPDRVTSAAILARLPGAGVDVIELGMPFTDPMADGPTIQAAALRSLRGGHRLAHTLDMVRDFRRSDDATPIVLMGYYNPIYIYGVARFLDEARTAGVDGLIVVDLPPEEDDELCRPALAAGLSFIRLATPTTDDRRLPAVLANTSGFVYYVSVTGITGLAKPDYGRVAAAVARLKQHTELPVAVGFGVKTPEDAAAVAFYADAVVVGTALIDRLAATLDRDAATAASVGVVEDFVRQLAGGVQGASSRGRALAAGAPTSATGQEMRS